MLTKTELASPVGAAELVASNEAIQLVHKRLLELGPGGADHREFREHVPMTPLVELPRNLLPADLRDADVTILLKCDNRMPGGAYKLRGIVSDLLTVPADRRAATSIVVASTGNHGTEAAIGGNLLGFATVTAYLPEHASPAKVANIKTQGATIEYRQTLEDCVNAAVNHGKQPDAVFVHPYDKATVVAGQGTAIEETARQTLELGVLPDDISLYFTVGGGGNAAGSSVAAKTYLPGSLFNVAQAAGTEAAVADLRGVPFDLNAFNGACDGAAVDKPGELPMQILKAPGMVDDAEVVTLGQVGEAMLVASKLVGVVEPAGAVALAHVFKHLREGRQKTNVLVAHISGGNATPAKVSEFFGYAVQEGLVGHREAFDVISRLHLEREPYGVSELTLHLGAASTQQRVWHGPTSVRRRA